MDSRSYHHGDLRQALLDAAEELLEREGVEALSIRAVARQVGVSHAAPAHHFGDLRGLLTALAADGFRRFALALAEAGPLAGQGAAYVRFARDHPGLFLLMFRRGVLDTEDRTLRDARHRAFGILRAGVSEEQAAADLETLTPGEAGPGEVYSGEAYPGDARPGDGGEAADLVAAIRPWCLAHGLAMLILDRQLPPAVDLDRLTAQIFGLDQG